MNTIFALMIAGLMFAQGAVPTADANKRGLTDKDFPRVVKLADNVAVGRKGSSRSARSLREGPLS